MATPALSVVVCTYNRADNLAACIGALASQADVSNLDWELLVVDNNSSDNTSRVLRDLADRHPRLNLRYVFEGEQGLSAARNRGIAESGGSVVAFIDDDIRVSPRWLAAVNANFARHACDAVGGPIHLDLETPLPRWVQPDMRGFLGYLDHGPTARCLDGRREFPFGGNMSFRREVFARTGGFDTGLGRSGEGTRRQELFKGEETDLFFRVAEAGGAIWYDPKALVFHKVLPRHLRKGYFRALHYNAGYLEGSRCRATAGRTLAGAPLYLFRQTAVALGRYLWLVATRGPNVAFRQQMTSLHFCGQVAGRHASSRRVAGNPPSPHPMGER